MKKILWKSCLAGIISLSMVGGSLSVPIYAGEFTDGIQDEITEGNQDLPSEEAFVDGMEEEISLFGDSPELQKSLVKASETEASIGSQEYDTLYEAWEEAQTMTEYNGNPVSEDNPVEIKVLKDCEVKKTLKQMKGHIKLTGGDGKSFTIKRAEGFTENLIYMGRGNVSGSPSVVDKERSLYLENIVIDGNGEKVEGSYSLIYMNGKDSSEHLILGKDAVLQNNNAGFQGGALCVGGTYGDENKSSKVTILEGAIIQNNSASSDGGAIEIGSEYSTVEMKGGEIKGNKVTDTYMYGGGICVSKGRFLMSGGTVKQNSTAYSTGGGGVYVNADAEKVMLTGGVITENTADKNNKTIQNVCLQSNAKLVLGDEIKIETTVSEGEKTYVDSGIYLNENNLIILDSPVENKFQLHFYLSVSEGQKVVEKGDNYGSSELVPEKFILDKPRYTLVKSEDGRNLVIQSTHYIVDGYATITGMDNITSFADLEEHPTGNDYVGNWKLDTEYEDDYAFYPYPNEEKWIVDTEDTTAEVSVSSKDDYDSVDITIKDCREYIAIMAYVEEKSPAPSLEDAKLQLNYAQNTITYDDNAYEVYQEKKKTEEGKIANGKDISTWIPEKTEETKTIYLRKKRTDTKVQSKWTPVTIYAHADFTGVDEALKRVPSNKDSYTSETWKVLESAIESVDRNKNASQQQEVNAMADRINKAVDNLEFIYIPPAEPTPKPLPENVPDGSKWEGENIVTPNDTVIKPDGTIILPDGTVLTPQEGNKPFIDKEGVVTTPDGIKIDEDGNITVPGLDKESSEDDVTITVGTEGKRPKLEPEAGKVISAEGSKAILPDGEGNRKELEIPESTVVTVDGLVTFPDGTIINQDGEIHRTDGSIWDLYGNVIRPGTPVIEIAETPGGNNKVKAVLLEECAGAIGYDYVISKNPNCIRDKDYDQIDKNRLETEGEFIYIQKGTYYVYCHAWMRNSQGKKVFSKWSNGKEVEVTARTPKQPRIRKVSVDKNKVTITYSKTANTEGYDLVLGKAVKKVNGELRPVDYGKAVKKIKNKNIVTVTFRNVPKGVYYVGLHAYNRTSENGKKVFSPWSEAKRIRVK